MSSSLTLPTYADVKEAAARLKRFEHLPETTLIPIPWLADATGAKTVVLLLDTARPLNMAGAEDAGNTFKLRGAANMIFKLLEERQANTPPNAPLSPLTAYTASAGNASQGFAAAWRRARMKGLLCDGDRAIVFMPITAPLSKAENTFRLGDGNVDVQQIGENFNEALQAMEKFARTIKGQRIYIPPFDHADIIAGQGTLAYELLALSEHVPDLLFMPCGGGGLAAGAQLVIAHDSPSTRIIAVEPCYVAKATQALHPDGKRALEKSASGLLDGLPPAGGVNVRALGDINLAIMKQGVSTRTVDNRQIGYGTLLLDYLLQWVKESGGPAYQNDVYHKYVAELSAGAAMAGFLNMLPEEIAGKHIVITVTGANSEVSMADLERAVIANETGKPATLENAHMFEEDFNMHDISRFPRIHNMPFYDPSIGL